MHTVQCICMKYIHICRCIIHTYTCCSLLHVFAIFTSSGFSHLYMKLTFLIGEINLNSLHCMCSYDLKVSEILAVFKAVKYSVLLKCTNIVSFHVIVILFEVSLVTVHCTCTCKHEHVKTWVLNVALFLIKHWKFSRPVHPKYNIVGTILLSWSHSTVFCPRISVLKSLQISLCQLCFITCTVVRSLNFTFQMMLQMTS